MADSYRLFLIEDDDDIALLISKNLERAGHQVARCKTAADALIVLGHTQYDLVLLDHRLPDMAGLDLLQAMNREGITTPALMVTAHGDEHLAANVLRAGALDYIIKDPALLFLGDLPKRIHESITRHRLQQMNRLLSEALESARDGVVITNMKGVILHVNRALERQTGYTRDELRLDSPQRLHQGTPSEGQLRVVWDRVLSRSSWQGELAMRRKDGTPLDVSLTVSPIMDSRGQMTHCIGIYRDVSERKHLERQLLHAQKMQSLGTLAGGIAHEFNNLLAGISGYTELSLREPQLPELARQFLQNVKELSDRAARLTNDMLAYARRPDLRRQPVSMEELLRSTAELVGRTLRLEVTLDMPPRMGEPPLVAAASAEELRHALLNLTMNARDALQLWPGSETPASAPIVYHLRHAVLTEAKPGFPADIPPGDYVVLEVADSGCGMAPEVLAQALDPFFTTKEVGRGTGLGLSLVTRIMEGHNGILNLESAPGRGTRVSMYLPRWVETSSTTQDVQPFSRGEVLEPETTPGRRVLVVDDEQAVRDVVRRFLEIAGHEVTCASSGPEGVAWVAAGNPVDLVILDLMMPKEDGLSTLQKLRQIRLDLPVLLCTGQHAEDPGFQLPPDGLVGIVRKPFRMTELWYAVRQALK